MTHHQDLASFVDLYGKCEAQIDVRQFVLHFPTHWKLVHDVGRSCVLTHHKANGTDLADLVYFKIFAQTRDQTHLDYIRYFRAQYLNSACVGVSEERKPMR
jgi:hypothetical protein